MSKRKADPEIGGGDRRSAGKSAWRPGYGANRTPTQITTLLKASVESIEEKESSTDAYNRTKQAVDLNKILDRILRSKPFDLTMRFLIVFMYVQPMFHKVWGVSSGQGPN